MTTESAETPAKRIASGYAVQGKALELGTVVVDGEADPTAQIRIPLATINRHGLVARATCRVWPSPEWPTKRPPRARKTLGTIGSRRDSRWSFCRWAPEGWACRCGRRLTAPVRFFYRKCWGSTLLKSLRWD